MWYVYSICCTKCNCRRLSRENSGSSEEMMSTPAKTVQKDNNTGEYIVRMSPEEFNRFTNKEVISDTK